MRRIVLEMAIFFMETKSLPVKLHQNPPTIADEIQPILAIFQKKSFSHG